jgi:DNA-binding transcriptional regulator PaaX
MSGDNKSHDRYFYCRSFGWLASVADMDAKTEELLWTLLWTCEMIARPTFRNLTESFEGWAYRNGFLRQLQRLERRHLLEKQSTGAGDRLHRLTEAGRLHALGGRDPAHQWKRPWDGRWRMVVFDVPEDRRGLRDKLRKQLHYRGFGYLQHSVWITPDSVSEDRRLLAGDPADVGSLILLEARPCAGETDAEIVAGAWDFAEINQRYAVHQQVLQRRPRGCLGSKAAAVPFRRWLQEEQLAWSSAIEVDPLLPARLLPSRYSGCDAWRHRKKVMAEAGEQMRAFRFG